MISGTHKRAFFAFMIGLLASSCGCSLIITSAGVNSARDFDFFQTREEVRKKFGDPIEIKTCEGGLIAETHWIRQKVDWSPPWRDLPGHSLGDAALIGLIWGTLDIFYIPVALNKSEEGKLHYALIYDERGQLLYRYNLEKPPSPLEFSYWMIPLSRGLYKNLKEGKCATWKDCINTYIKGIKQRASCVGYSSDAEDDGKFEDLITISDWVDSGQISGEEGLNDLWGVITHERAFWFYD